MATTSTMPLRNFKLTLEAKRHIVWALAGRVRHDDIVEQVCEQFNISIHKRALRHYHPSQNPRLDDELKTLYEETRAQFWHEAEMETQAWFERRREERQREHEAQRAKMKRDLLDKLGKS